jgi:hypothetical protein
MPMPRHPTMAMAITMNDDDDDDDGIRFCANFASFAGILFTPCLYVLVFPLINFNTLGSFPINICTVILIIDSVDFHSEWSVLLGPILAW